MKKLPNPLNPKRYYRVVEVHENDAYSRDAIEGTILQPRLSRHSIAHPKFFGGTFAVIKSDYFSSETIIFFAVRLRVLTAKQQEKIDESIG